jgi:hypothetical protein
MLNFVQATITEVTDLVVERGKNAFLENSSALVCCGFLEPARLFFSERLTYPDAGSGRWLSFFHTFTNRWRPGQLEER